MNWARHSPPDTGGVAAPSRKRCEATAAAQTGWSGLPKCFKMHSLKEVPLSTTPAAPLKEASRPRVSQRFRDDNHRLLISSMLSRLRVEIDLNLFPFRQHPSATLRQETTGELGKNDFLSAYGLSSFTRIPPMR